MTFMEPVACHTDEGVPDRVEDVSPYWWDTILQLNALPQELMTSTREYRRIARCVASDCAFALRADVLFAETRGPVPDPPAGAWISPDMRSYVFPSLDALFTGAITLLARSHGDLDRASLEAVERSVARICDKVSIDEVSRALEIVL